MAVIGSYSPLRCTDSTTVRTRLAANRGEPGASPSVQVTDFLGQHQLRAVPYRNLDNVAQRRCPPWQSQWMSKPSVPCELGRMYMCRKAGAYSRLSKPKIVAATCSLSIVRSPHRMRECEIQDSALRAEWLPYRLDRAYV